MDAQSEERVAHGDGRTGSRLANLQLENEASGQRKKVIYREMLSAKLGAGTREELGRKEEEVCLRLE